MSRLLAATASSSGLASLPKYPWPSSVGIDVAIDEGDVWISTPDCHALRYVVSEIHPSVPPNDPRFIVVALPG